MFKKCQKNIKTFRFTFLVIYGLWSDQSILAECHPLLRVPRGVTVQILLSLGTQQWFYLAFSSFETNSHGHFFVFLLHLQINYFSQGRNIGIR